MIMNYEQKYEEVKRFIKDLYPHMSDYCKEKIEGFFPELKESEDEDKIMKELIYNIIVSNDNTPSSKEIFSVYSKTKEDALAWLEKQGESYTKRDVDDAYLEGFTVAKNVARNIVV